MPKQASLSESDVFLDSPLEGQSLWDLALITPGLARSHLPLLLYLIASYCCMIIVFVIFLYFIPLYWT